MIHEDDLSGLTSICINRLDKAFGLVKSDNYSTCSIELNEEALAEKQTLIAERLLVGNDFAEDTFYSAALVMYGFRVGATHTNGRNECLTRQVGYRDLAVWAYDLDEVLGTNISIDAASNSSNCVIDWIMNPAGNADIADIVLHKMIVPIVKKLNMITPPGMKSRCRVVLPPLSNDIEFNDWHELLSDIHANDLYVQIDSFASLFTLEPDERKYFVQYQSINGLIRYMIVSAYEQIRGHNACIGSMAFDLEGSEFPLHEIEPVGILIDNSKKCYESSSVPSSVPLHDWEYVECSFPVRSSLAGYLGSHASSFGKEMFRATGENTPRNDIEDRILSVFLPNESLQVSEICARLLDRTNLLNISLGDLCYISSILEKSTGFSLVSIKTNKAYKLGTYQRLSAKIEPEMLSRLPSNFDTFEWSLADKRTKIMPYFELDPTRHSEQQIIVSIVNHYDHCTTAMVADDLLYLYKNGEDPSAYFVAKVFIYLSRIDSLRIESRNEFITHIENVDNVRYIEIEKPSKAPSASRGFRKTATANHRPQKRDIHRTLSIEMMDFSVKTYNCLRRAGIHTAEEIASRTETELSKVRNLGKTGRLEIIRKLEALGMKLRDE